MKTLKMRSGGFEAWWSKTVRMNGMQNARGCRKWKYKWMNCKESEMRSELNAGWNALNEIPPISRIR